MNTKRRRLNITLHVAQLASERICAADRAGITRSVEQANGSAVRADKRADERMAQQSTRGLHTVSTQGSQYYNDIAQLLSIIRCRYIGMI